MDIQEWGLEGGRDCRMADSKSVRRGVEGPQVRWGLGLEGVEARRIGSERLWKERLWVGRLRRGCFFNRVVCSEILGFLSLFIPNEWFKASSSEVF